MPPVATNSFAYSTAVMEQASYHTDVRQWWDITIAIIVFTALLFCLGIYSLSKRYRNRNRNRNRYPRRAAQKPRCASCGRETRLGRHWFGCTRVAPPPVYELTDVGLTANNSRAAASNSSGLIVQPSWVDFPQSYPGRSVTARDWV